MPDGGLESLKLELSRGKDVGQDGKVLVFDRARVHCSPSLADVLT